MNDFLSVNCVQNIFEKLVDDSWTVCEIETAHGKRKHNNTTKMKKTLLIAAAALAAGVISTQAQVYSQNVVGYVNQPIPAGAYQIIGSQLINGSDANQTNGDVNATLVNGLISSPVPSTGANPQQDPALSTNSVLFVWTGSGYATYYYFNAADATSWEGATSPQGWYASSGSMATGITLTGGKSAFIQNKATVPLTVTTVGTVAQGTNVTTINAGYNLIGLQEPISTNPLVGGYGLPLTLTSSNDVNNVNDVPTPQSNDAIFVWTGSGYATYFFFNQSDATTWEGFSAPAGFYDQAGAAMPTAAYPQVNQGFFLFHSGAPLLWTNSFSVQ